jgi:hypothetical protein
MPIPRTKKKLTSEYKALLRVDVDFGSSGIWEIREPKQRYAGCCWLHLEGILPAWLVKRFDFWAAWYDVQEPWNGLPRVDSELFEAYGRSLAIDLKCVLGDDYYVEFGGREIHDDYAYLRELKSKKKR